jgi:cytosine/adenosine deaminase-related metal-dependent hydrolase
MISSGSSAADARILIRGAAGIMTGDTQASRADGCDIRIRGTKIAAVGRLEPDAGERVLDATGCIIYPGWVNTHHHLLQTLMKGVPGGMNVSLREWLDAVPFAYRMRLDAETLETATLLGMAELMLAGCTTLADFHNLYYPGIAFDSSAVMYRAAEQLGMRFVLCRGFGTRARPVKDPNSRVMPPEDLRDVLADLERLATQWHDPAPDAMRRLAVAPSSFMLSTEAGKLREVAGQARRLGLRMHSHLAENADDVVICREVHDLRPMEYAARQDWVGPDVWFAHLVHLDDEDIRILGATGTGIAHCPGSNARIGNGIARVLEMRDAGAAISLGQDGSAANDPGDMISEAHFAWYIHRANSGYDAVSIADVVHWGTRGGAQVLGLDAVGLVAPGHEADLAVYRLDDIRFAGFHDPAIAPVATGVRPFLKYLMVGGRITVHDDTLLGLDLDQLRPRVAAGIRRLLEAD